MSSKSSLEVIFEIELPAEVSSEEKALLRQDLEQISGLKTYLVESRSSTEIVNTIIEVALAINAAIDAASWGVNIIDQKKQQVEESITKIKSWFNSGDQKGKENVKIYSPKSPEEKKKINEITAQDINKLD